MIDCSRDLIAKSQNLLLRWLAACTGLVAVSGGAMTSLYLPFPVMLIVGAAILGKWPRTGRWLMWIGASVLSVCLLPTYILLLREMHFSYADLLILLIDIGWIGTLILLPLFDVMLLIDAFKRQPAKISV
jgi:hypothetical protein